MEPLTLSTSAMQTSPAATAHHGHLHRQLLHQAWGFPSSSGRPGSPSAATSAAAASTTDPHYEASVVAASLLHQNDAWAHHPMLDTTPATHTWIKEEVEPAAPASRGEATHDDSGISPGRTSSSGPSSNGGSPPGPVPTSEHPHNRASPPKPPELQDIAEDECRSSPVTHDDDSSETSEDTMDSLSRLQMALSQSGSPLGDIYNANSDEPQTIQCPLCSHVATSMQGLAAHLNTHVEHKSSGSEEMLCPMCNHVCSSHEDFVAHLSAHYAHPEARSPRKSRSGRRCSVCDFTTKSSSKLKSHLAEVHGFEPGENDADMTDEDVNTPRVNSQGKVKTFRCKQCNFVAVTKLDFWSHTRSHIKSEKMLSCPRCPFVTEYKHHLEYHLRNHSGSKPFKCSQCSYSCVNKSMLNSHLKSHSNVYQYRCADCNYATKYCHSLKLHLRKYTHQPAMVLNPDGSPNPLPIIDVYGTRRGPKAKKTDSQLDIKQQQQRKSPVNIPPYPTTQSYLANPSPEEPPHQCAQCDFSTPSQEHFAQHLLTAHNGNNKSRSPPILIPTPEKVIQPHPILIPQPQQMKEYLTWMYAQQKHAMELYQQYKEASLPEIPVPSNPLDLSKEVKKSDSEAINNNVVSTNKNRRKGKAFKLERIVVQEDEADLKPPPSKIMVIDVNKNKEMLKPELPSQQFVPLLPQSSPDAKSEATPNQAAESSVKSLKPITDSNDVPPPVLSVASIDNQPTYNCGYCDILFRDVVMYTMHMGYHGYKDPFHCNMCGQQTSDKLAFFLHIARSSHC